MTRVTRVPHLDIDMSKVKVIRSQVKTALFQSVAHNWWRHLTNNFTNIGVNCQQLH